MKNIEFYREEIKKSFDETRLEYNFFYSLGYAICEIFLKYKKPKTRSWSFDNVYNWLLEEHKSNNELTQMEYDLLKMEDKKDIYFEDSKFLMFLRKKGHFKDVDENKSISYILECAKIKKEE